MIRSFKDRRTQAIFERRSPGKGFPPDLVRPARRKLIMLARARALKDLLSPPGNRLEALRQFSIRINDQWRICFVWAEGDAEDVEIVDYH